MRLGNPIMVFVEEPHRGLGSVSFQRRAVVADEQLPGGAVAVYAGLQAGDRVATNSAIVLLTMFE